MDQKQLEKRALAPLKEKISHFLYRNFIDFERDWIVKVGEQQFEISFYLPKCKAVIDCLALAGPENPEYQRRYDAYRQDGVKFLFMDMRNLADADAFLKQNLSSIGCPA